MNKIYSLTLQSGMDVLAEFVETQFDEQGNTTGVTVRNPQVFILMSNQFLPYAACLDYGNRNEELITLPMSAIVVAGPAIEMFAEAYRQTFPQQFMTPEEIEDMKKEESAILSESKARADLAEAASPVHGETQSESGIILKA